MTEIELKIRDYMGNLSSAEQRAAKYLINHFESALNLSVDELALKSDVSKATWIRFSKSMGYSGIKDLKKNIITNLQNTVNTQQQKSDSGFSELKSNNSFDNIIAHIGQNSITAIEQTLLMADAEALNLAAADIINARSVRLFGLAASGVVAKDFAQKLTRMGKCVVYFEDFEENLMAAASMTAEDVAIFISSSGKTKDIVELLKIVKDTSAKIVGITKFSQSYLTELSDHKLFFTSPETEKRIGATSSRIAQLILVDVLYSIMLKMDIVNVTPNLTKTYNISRLYKSK